VNYTAVSADAKDRDVVNILLNALAVVFLQEKRHL